MSAHLLCTGVLSAKPEKVEPHPKKRRPLYRGALAFQTETGTWWPASFATWSTSVADELASLEIGDAIAFQARLTLGYYEANGRDAIRVNLQLEKLIALPKPSRPRPGLPPDDQRLAGSQASVAGD